MKIIPGLICFGLVLSVFSCGLDLKGEDLLNSSNMVCENSKIAPKLLPAAEVMLLNEMKNIRTQINNCLELRNSDQEQKSNCQFLLIKFGALHKVNTLHDFFIDKISEMPFVKKGSVTIDRSDCFGIPVNNAALNELTIKKFNDAHTGYRLRLKSTELTQTHATYTYSIERDGYVAPLVDVSLQLLIYLGLEKNKNEKI